MRKEFKVGDRVAFDYYVYTDSGYTFRPEKGVINQITKGGCLVIDGDKAEAQITRTPREVTRLIKKAKHPPVYINIYDKFLPSVVHDSRASAEENSAQSALEKGVKYVRAKDQS